MNRRIRDKIFGFFGVFLWINASSFFSKKIRDWDRVAFGSLSRYLLKIAV
jgi:hypothetical protein